MEGYGSTIERHASKLRGNQEQVNYANEAFIHINGSLLHNADYLVERALNLHFGNDKDDGKLKPWHFCNTTESLAKNAGVHGSVSVEAVEHHHPLEGVIRGQQAQEGGGGRAGGEGGAASNDGVA